MAEIEVQRRRTNPWPWALLVLLLLAAAVWWIAGSNDDDAPVVAEENPAFVEEAAEQGGAEAAAVTPATDFANWLEMHTIEGAAGVEHTYVADGLRATADAIAGVAGGRADVQSSLDDIRQRADALQREASSNRHAEMVRDAFQSVIAALRSLDSQEPLEALERTADDIRADQPLLDQMPQVRQFFRGVADALADLRTS